MRRSKKKTEGGRGNVWLMTEIKIKLKIKNLELGSE